jgi:FixJ family two-component response regulator
MNRDDSTVFVIDDDVSIREALQNLFRSVGLKVKTFGSAQEYLSVTENVDVSGCLVLDVRLPGTSGLDLQRQLVESNTQIPILFITGHGDIQMSVRAMKAGAVEFLTKPFRDQDLLDAVQQALDRDRVHRGRRAELSELQKRYESLTSREQQVMRLVVQGVVNKQIANQLNVSEPTVKMHRGHVMQKMQAGSLADLIKLSEKLQAPGDNSKSLSPA